MTAEELRSLFNRVYGIETAWPPRFEVDADTYANCCQFTFKHLEESLHIIGVCMEKSEVKYYKIELAIGPNHGLMFKGVELILKS